MRAASCAIVTLPLLLAACDPLGDGDEGERIVPDGQGASVTLLTPARHLPGSATNIAVRKIGFQDPIVWVRFDAPLADARAFSVDMLGGPGAACGWHGGADGWPATLPKNATCGRRDAAGVRWPAIMVAVIPHGARAVVLVRTFTT